jgi:hypothetical protein
MAVVKRINSDYNLTALDSNVDVTATTVTINGNLVVVGTSSKVESVDTFIYDNFITLASGQAGGPNLDAGIEVDRGTLPKVGLRWHEATTEWQYTIDGTLWNAFSRTIVELDKNPKLGGNLIVNGFMITADPGEAVEIGPIVRLPQITTDPAPKAGYSTIYAKATKEGDTGFFVANENVQGNELITKRKAFVYSLIL